MRQVKWSLLLCCFLSVVIAASLVVPASATEAKLTQRSDFIWGVNGHNYSYAAYPKSAFEQQIKLAAELGVGVYRFNFVSQHVGALYIPRLCRKSL